MLRLLQFTFNQPPNIFPIAEEGEQIVQQINKKEKEIKKENKKEKNSDVFADIPMEYTYYGNGINFYENQ